MTREVLGWKVQDSFTEIVPLSQVHLIIDGTSPRESLCHDIGHNNVYALHRSQAIGVLLRLWGCYFDRLVRR